MCYRPLSLFTCLPSICLSTMSECRGVIPCLQAYLNTPGVLEFPTSWFSSSKFTFYSPLPLLIFFPTASILWGRWFFPPLFLIFHARGKQRRRHPAHYQMDIDEASIDKFIFSINNFGFNFIHGWGSGFRIRGSISSR